MKYILENPTFANEPIEIDNHQAVKTLDAHMSRPQGVTPDDLLLVVVHNIYIKLQMVSKSNDVCVLRQLPTRYS